MTKKHLLIIEAVSVVLISILVFIQNGDICYSQNWCRGLWEGMNVIGVILLIIVSLLPFSLITYKMKEEVFRAWWNFARWFVPIIIVVTYLLNNAPTGNSLDAGQDAIFFILFILYAILIITSLTKIVQTYRKTKV